MYLWCSKCSKAHTDVKWNVDMFKYGVCPACGSSAYRNALNWTEVYTINGYSEVPEQGKVYTMWPEFDI